MRLATSITSVLAMVLAVWPFGGWGWLSAWVAPAPVLIAAGDIADCSTPGASVTARIVDQIPGTVATLGNAAYLSGTAEQYANCYDPAWGRFKSRTRPTPGDHDYGTRAAWPYFAYFGSAAGAPGEGYYSYDLGSWHIVVLNSNCARVGGCGPGTAQELWLKADLAAHPDSCVLAYWHHPLYSSADARGHNFDTRPFWTDLYAAGADVVLNGHADNYERFAPQNDAGMVDPEGIREFVVGTGGYDHRPVTNVVANSEARIGDAYGVLKLTLHAKSYDWEFVPEPGKHETDAGTARCHRAGTGVAGYGQSLSMASGWR